MSNVGSRGIGGTPVDQSSPGGSNIAPSELADASIDPGYLVFDGGSWIYKAEPTAGKSEFQMAVCGFLSGETLPLTDLGTEIALNNQSLSLVRAIRGASGPSGTTTIELEVNGAPTGITLSWVGGTDADNAEKNAAISQAVSAGDRVSFRITSVEDGDPADVFVRVR